MKVVVIGGTGLIGSKTSPFCASAATTSSLRRPKAASTCPSTATTSASMPATQARLSFSQLFVVDTNETELTIPFAN